MLPIHGPAKSQEVLVNLLLDVTKLTPDQPRKEAPGGRTPEDCGAVFLSFVCSHLQAASAGSSDWFEGQQALSGGLCSVSSLQALVLKLRPSFPSPFCLLLSQVMSDVPFVAPITGGGGGHSCSWWVWPTVRVPHEAARPGRGLVLSPGQAALGRAHWLLRRIQAAVSTAAPRSLLSLHLSQGATREPLRQRAMRGRVPVSVCAALHTTRTRTHTYTHTPRRACERGPGAAALTWR